ncbi:GAF domain-containing protein [Vibrio sp. T187]|uniref:HD domain-containing phosphohydrolase n=1 Tax=Vibrio TaxID=662 RepID=UPI0010C9FB3C|nr:MULTISPECIES: HD domain-containing phosphohydrolase [Vibrio]MBW3695415.1 GAF domain-containing protein [Vibrio sp. T187]
MISIMDFAATPSLVIAHGSGFGSTELPQQLSQQQIQCVEIACLNELEASSPALLILDQPLIEQLPKEQLAQYLQSHPTLLLAEQHLDIEADLYLPIGFSQRVTKKHIHTALTQFVLAKQQLELTQLLKNKSINLQRLADIGIALSAEKSLAALLTRILDEGRKLAVCDAASLFLLDSDNKGNDYLILKLTQNASIDFQFEERRFPLNDTSISGYVASYGFELNIEDVYQLDDAPYSFNPVFDHATGYRCQSLLALPIKNHDGDIIGVLQFINRKKTADTALLTHKITRENVIPFDDNVNPLLRALASQSAIAIENRRLIESIRHLFEGFVQASVTAIEQRDPTTSGHSFRVADLSVALAQAIPDSGLTQYQHKLLNKKDLRQLKYAALLHDFGKVGVREAVLTKAKKLTTHQLDVIKYRIRLTQQTLMKERAEAELKLFQQHRCLDADEQLHRQKVLQQQIVQLEEFWQDILQANEPSILPESVEQGLHRVHQCQAYDENGALSALISTDELAALSIPKGSLTIEEMDEIRSHVTHTENFLKQIPWTNELKDVPDIAGAHHEKRDGSGYPRGLHHDQIPLASQIMTICDIYDALTASDRPYKQALPNEVAFKILTNEAESQQLNVDLVRLFIDAKVYLVIQGKHYNTPSDKTCGFHHHVCDFDLLDDS